MIKEAAIFVIFVVLVVTSVYSKNNTTDYYVGGSKTTWRNASEQCKTMNMDLVQINSATENEQLKQFLTSKGYNDEYWIGLNDIESEGHFTWNCDKTLPLFTNWEQGQPDDFFWSEDCACINCFQKNFKWNDRYCGEAFKYICSKCSVLKKNDSNVGIIIGVVLAVTVMVVSIPIIYCCCKKKCCCATSSGSPGTIQQPSQVVQSIQQQQQQVVYNPSSQAIGFAPALPPYSQSGVAYPVGNVPQAAYQQSYPPMQNQGQNMVLYHVKEMHPYPSQPQGIPPQGMPPQGPPRSQGMPPQGPPHPYNGTSSYANAPPPTSGAPTGIPPPDC